MMPAAQALTKDPGLRSHLPTEEGARPERGPKSCRHRAGLVPKCTRGPYPPCPAHRAGLLVG